jgi:hypothetical protein
LAHTTHHKIPIWTTRTIANDRPCGTSIPSDQSRTANVTIAPRMIISPGSPRSVIRRLAFS